MSTGSAPVGTTSIGSSTIANTTVINAIDAAFRREWPQLVATLVRELGDLALAEDVAQDAFAEASKRWRTDEIPRKPGAWLLTTARRKAIDRIRRDKRFEDRIPALAEAAGREIEPKVLADDQLALLFGCCHPALGPEAQVALTLRSVAGLTTSQIAHAFIVPEATMAKRLVRAKNKIREAGIPFVVPDRDRLGERLVAVCGVIYAIFTEGHASSTGASLIRGSLCDEAIWLAETLTELAPEETEVRGLAALCLLTDARRAARVDADGEPILLADQDRALWDRDKIQRGLDHLQVAAGRPDAGSYQLQATVAALHSTAPTFDATDWEAILALYTLMAQRGGGPVVELNRAVALAEARGPAEGLRVLDEIEAEGTLSDYHYLHSARAELLHRLGRAGEAIESIQRAIDVCENESEAQWLQTRRGELASGG